MGGYLALLLFVALVAFIPSRGPFARMRLWFVAAISLAFLLYLLVFVDDGLPTPRGPGGGGEGVYFLAVWGARLFTATVLVVSLVRAGHIKPKR